MKSEYDLLFEIDDRARSRARPKFNRTRFGQPEGKYGRGRDFSCAHCGRLVISNVLVSGVQNRNHCPYCLWSRCLDLYAPGDRLSACKAPMRPVALSSKPARKKYGDRSGELQIVHLCSECGKVSPNRLAADDDAAAVWTIFELSLYPDACTETTLQKNRLLILDAGWAGWVKAQIRHA